MFLQLIVGFDTGFITSWVDGCPFVDGNEIYPTVFQELWGHFPRGIFNDFVHPATVPYEFIPFHVRPICFAVVLLQHII